MQLNTPMQEEWRRWQIDSLLCRHGLEIGSVKPSNEPLIETPTGMFFKSLADSALDIANLAVPKCT